MGNAISGFYLGQKLYEAGVIPEHCTRVIIDIAMDNIVQVYYQMHGDNRLVDIDLARKHNA